MRIASVSTGWSVRLNVNSRSPIVDAVTVGDDPPPERRLGRVTAHDVDELAHRGRRVHGHAFDLKAVLQRVAEHAQLAPVVGMAVAHHDRVERGDVDVLLQVAERARPGVDPDARGAATHQVATACATRAGVGTRAPEDRDAQRHDVNPMTAPPLARARGRAAADRSPRTTGRHPTTRSDACREGIRCLVPGRSRRALPAPANAVSSADDTSTTSRPITSLIVRAR